MQSSLNTLECKRHNTQRSRGLHTGLETYCSVQIFETTQTVSQVLKDQFVQASCLSNFYMGISRRVSALSSQFGNTQYNHRLFFRCHARALTGNTRWSFELFSHLKFLLKKRMVFPEFFSCCRRQNHNWPYVTQKRISYPPTQKTKKKFPLVNTITSIFLSPENKS